MRRHAFAFLFLAFGFATANPAAAQGGVAPAVLSAADVTRYRQIIADERAGRNDHADALIAKLEDRSLIGYVEAERLLSPHSGRAKLPVLVKWLKTYGDLPIASRVRKLAVQRATKKVKRHHRRVTIVTANIPGLPAAQHRGGGYEEFEQIEPPVVSDAARTVQEQIVADIKAGNPDNANAALQALIAAGTAPTADVAKLSRRVCTSYLIEGFDEQAYALGGGAADSGRADAPLLDWCAGLSAFRLQKYAEAARHFEILAAISSQPAATRAGAALWAARAEQRNGKPSKVVGYLQMAAAIKPTFYGLIAEKMLGYDEETGFSEPIFNPADFARVIENAPTRRAVALWQINEKKYEGFTNAELNRGFGQAAKLKLDAAYAYLARKIGVPNLELRASETTASRGVLLTGLFPIPPYQPLGGYTIDHALVLAIIRIETRFQTNGVSPVGAMGLMQLMPYTAKAIGGKAAAGDALLDPEYNMTIGQRYVARLLNGYGGNLIKLGAAYNAGPGKVKQWATLRAGKEDDPLMFIESMQAPDTRSYVKRMLTYYWMYHRRNGDAAPSLEETARGAWPIYHPPAQSAPPPPPADTDDDDDDDDINS
jgi:soluble lytic murein transglycosylase